MPALLPDTLEKEDISLEELFDFDIRPQCDNENCSREATHTIRCACRAGIEFSCYPCILAMKQFPGAVIIFDPQKSCGHTVPLDSCEINPI